MAAISATPVAVSHARQTPPSLRDHRYDGERFSEGSSVLQIRDTGRQFESRVNQTCPEFMDECFGQGQNVTAESQIPGDLGNFLFRMRQVGSLQELLLFTIVNDIDTDDEESRKACEEQIKLVMEKEKKLEWAYRRNKQRFPTQIWHSCKQMCFSRIESDPDQFPMVEELAVLHM